MFSDVSSMYMYSSTSDCKMYEKFINIWLNNEISRHSASVIINVIIIVHNDLTGLNKIVWYDNVLHVLTVLFINTKVKCKLVTNTHASSVHFRDFVIKRVWENYSHLSVQLNSINP